MHAMLEEYTLTVAEAAELLGGTEKAIQRLIFTARLDAIRVKRKRGHEFRIRPSDILDHQAELQQQIADGPPEATDPRPPTSDAQHPALATAQPEPGDVLQELEMLLRQATYPAPPLEEFGGEPQNAFLLPAFAYRPTMGSRTTAPTLPNPSPAPPEGPTAAHASAGVADLPGSYLELFRRYDQLGRRAVKLEYENYLLQKEVEHIQARTQMPSIETNGDLPSAPPAPGRSFWRLLGRYLRRPAENAAPDLRSHD